MTTISDGLDSLAAVSSTLESLGLDPAYLPSLDLDDMSIHSPEQIKAGLEFCKGDSKLFYQMCRDRDRNMIAHINRVAVNSPLWAVVHGGSWKRKTRKQGLKEQWDTRRGKKP